MRSKKKKRNARTTNTKLPPKTPDLKPLIPYNMEKKIKAKPKEHRLMMKNWKA
jgi:hypothetical protein